MLRRGSISPNACGVHRCTCTDRDLIGLEESLGVKGESETLTSSLGPQRQLEQKRKRKTEESEEEKEREILM